jgi:hypothetical protein
VAVVLLSLTVLLPNPRMVFALDAVAVDEDLHSLDLDQAHRRLAYWLQSYRAGNQAAVDRAFQSFRCAGAALVAQTLLLTVALVVR